LEIFFEDAYRQAQELDDYFAEQKKPLGPLHGVPVSLKDQLHVKGVETTMGYVGWIGTFEGKKGTGHEKNFESLLVTELRALGAVLYCKTSVPHTLMAGETSNNIMGYAWNPKNRNLSPGGSSGGEGALIGLKGSPLGFGTVSSFYFFCKLTRTLTEDSRTSAGLFVSQPHSMDSTASDRQQGACRIKAWPTLWTARTRSSRLWDLSRRRCAHSSLS